MKAEQSSLMRLDISLLSVILMTLVVAGCASVTPVEAPSILEEPLPPVEIPPYSLQRGDLISVRFWGNPELDDEMTIRPDGRITLPFVDDVVAEGRTPAELDAELTRLYGAELAEPNITVTVRDAMGQQFYIGGEVADPGLYDLRGPVSVYQAVTTAGGFLPSAYRREVILIRTYADGSRIARSMNMLPVESGQLPGIDVPLQVADLIFVPRKKITTFDQFVTQYIDPLYKIIPIRFVAINPFAGD